MMTSLGIVAKYSQPMVLCCASAASHAGTQAPFRQPRPGPHGVAFSQATTERRSVEHVGGSEHVVGSNVVGAGAASGEKGSRAWLLVLHPIASAGTSASGATKKRTRGRITA